MLALPVFAIDIGGPIVVCGGPDGPQCTICHIPYTIKNVIDYVIEWFVFPASLLMVILGGFMILTAGASQQRIETGKKLLTNTLIGIVFVFFSWFIVDTIILIMTGGSFMSEDVGAFRGIGDLLPWNELPATENCKLGGSAPTPASTGGSVFTGGPSGGTSGGTTPPPSPPRPAWAPERKLIGSHVLECQTVESCTCDGQACAVFPSTIVPLKQYSKESQACAGQSNGYCYISPETESRLKNMQIGLINSGAGEQLQVTEAWPPTRVHQNVCHQEATCVDMNFRPGQAATASKISNAISKADAAGLRAVYEVKTQTEKNALVGQGVPAGHIQVVSDITGPHFSVYKK